MVAPVRSPLGLPHQTGGIIMRTIAKWIAVASLPAAIALGSQSGAAQAQSGCVLDQVGGTGRQVIRCGNGVTVTAEKGARYDLLDRNRDGSVDGVRVSSKAVLVDVPPGSVKAFQVVAPQAIAAVRGTRWAVDVAAGKTSVFVVRGSVAVNRTRGGSGVTLGPGEGVDVTAGSQPLEVRRWPARRARALLSRLGG